MNNAWVIIKNGEIYGVAENRWTVYKIMRQAISSPIAIASLKNSYEKFGQRITVNKSFYAEEWGIAKQSEVK